MNVMFGDGIRANMKRAVAFERKPHKNRKRSWIINNEHEKEEKVKKKKKMLKFTLNYEYNNQLVAHDEYTQI